MGIGQAVIRWCGSILYSVYGRIDNFSLVRGGGVVTYLSPMTCTYRSNLIFQKKKCLCRNKPYLIHLQCTFKTKSLFYKSPLWLQMKIASVGKYSIPITSPVLSVWTRPNLITLSQAGGAGTSLPLFFPRIGPWRLVKWQKGVFFTCYNRLRSRCKQAPGRLRQLQELWL